MDQEKKKTEEARARRAAALSALLEPPSPGTFTALPLDGTAAAGMWGSLYVCPHTAIYVSAYRYICVLILLYMCPHTAIYVGSMPVVCAWWHGGGTRGGVTLYMHVYTSVCGLKLLVCETLSY
jgi:hypothetical protein